LSEEDLVHYFADEKRDDERLQVEHGHARVGLGQVDYRRIELFLMIESIQNDDEREREA
jgi:hypothetical protein